MPRFSPVLAALAGLILLLAGASPAGAGEAEAAAAARSNNLFALNLYRQLVDIEAGQPGREGGSLFFSPYSAATALAMALAGARGQTAAQMARVLGFSLPQAEVHPALAELAGQIEAAGRGQDQELALANAVWPRAGLELTPEYLNLIRTNYGQEVRQLDFCDEPKARRTINAWVAGKTRERIQDLIAPRMLDCQTMLVLTNAIYFLGKWASAFDPSATRPGPFWPRPEDRLETPFMHLEDRFPYAERPAGQVLELPYLGQRLAMVILLPRQKDGLGDLEKSLSPESLADWLAGLRPQEVMVSLPRFKLKTRYLLQDSLQAAGMTEAFTPRADFSGLTGRPGPYIDLVVHQAWLEVEESGTEAAAATAVIITKSAPGEPTVFRADHPFLFLIRDRQTGAILFLGRLSRPESS